MGKLTKIQIYTIIHCVAYILLTAYCRVHLSIQNIIISTILHAVLFFGYIIILAYTEEKNGKLNEVDSEAWLVVSISHPVFYIVSYIALFIAYHNSFYDKVSIHKVKDKTAEIYGGKHQHIDYLLICEDTTIEVDRNCYYLTSIGATIQHKKRISNYK